jgi:hypothetical protein
LASAGARDGVSHQWPQCDATLRQPQGRFYQPFTEGELRGKFRELTGRMLTTKGTGLVEQAIDRSADWQTVDALTTLCRRHGCEQ